jgi:hypothetical protein
MNCTWHQCVFAQFVIAILVHASDLAAETPSLGRHISPLLYKLGCSAGECHGSFSGKGNLRLSLFAADAELDYREIHAGFDRRINRQSPELSLLLRKPTNQMPHGGGARLQVDSPEYKLLLKWIIAGAPADPLDLPKVQAVRVEPATIVASPQSVAPRVRVFAKFSDGREVDVTPFARFESLDSSIATADRQGQVETLRSGDTYVLAHYAGQIGYLATLAPGPTLTEPFPTEKLDDPIDRALVDKLRRLNIVPSGIVGDTDFLRRVYLDVVGRLPTPDEVRAFLADKSSNKRQQVIDRLLVDPLHAAVWANKFCDAMGADNRTMYDESVYRIFDWMRNRFERNTPWDEIVRGALTGTIADGRSLEELQRENERLIELRKQQTELQKQGKKPEDTKLDGKPWHTKLANRQTLEDFSYNLKFRVQAGPRKGRMDPRPLAQHVATAFLGVRLECAECHKHPHDRWSQQDFFSFTSCFAYLDRGLSPEMREQKLNYINGTFVTAEPQETFPDPKTGEILPPRPLDGPVIEVKPGVDPRLEVWRWMVAPENPYFTRAIVNRVWAHYFGRGLIDPVDALAEANPPSHPEILDELVRDFREHKFDLRHLHRRLLNTRAYQRDWATNASNHADERNYSHRVLRRMSAELMLDAVNDVTGAKLVIDREVYGGPKDNRTIERAIEMPLSRPRGDDSYVLKIFDKPQRTQSCDCERSSAPNLSQALFFYNDTALVAKITDPAGRLTRLLGTMADNDRLLDELYLAALSRLPTETERKRSAEHVQDSKSRQEAFEDLFWSLLNRHEFLVTH